MAEGYAFYEYSDEGILIKELALISMDALTAVAILHRALRAGRYCLRLPAERGGDGAIRTPFGMIHWLGKEPASLGEPPYLALAMD
jgi:hypothetical protein